MDTTISGASSASSIPLDLTIRFAAALPDLTIPIPDATTTTVSFLKKQIRALRHDDTAKRRLKLIYGGRVLTTGDGRMLAEQMRLIRPSFSPPPPSRPTSAVTKGKGKEVERGGSSGTCVGPRGSSRETPDAQKAYVHCAIGDEATDEELLLEDEEGKTSASATAIAAAAATGAGARTASTSTPNDHQPSPSTLPQPLGFDRLLSAGFSETDIAQLRAQFNRIHNITPDSPPEMARTLEERWMDEAAGAGVGDLADGSPAGTYEDMFFGVAIGFFWPVAVLALREEGIFTKRRGMAIVAGLLVNLLAAVLRLSS